jgi:hypothetical protein
MNFELIPFIPNDLVPKINGTIERHLPQNGQGTGTTLSLTIESNKLTSQAVIWPSQVQLPQRMHNLWESTCFECFIGVENNDSYIEINVSPSGDWQAYEFTSYRHGQQDCKNIQVAKIFLNEPNGSQSLAYQIDIDHPLFVTSMLKISVSAVLAFKSDELSYYAGHHPTSKPDFHLADLRRLEFDPSQALPPL